MANTCLNTIKIEGPRRTLVRIKNEINKTIAESPQNKTCDLYRLLQSLRYNDKTLKGVSCREEFNSEPNIRDGVLTILSESAWSFQGTAWELVCRHFPSISVLFLAEEFGCDIFITNDTEHRLIKTRYAIDWSNAQGDGEIEYFDDEHAFTQYVHDNIDIEVNDFESARKAVIALNNSKDCFGYIREVEYQTGYNLN